MGRMKQEKKLPFTLHSYCKMAFYLKVFFYVYPLLLRLLMAFSITESAGFSYGYLLPSQVVKTQPEFSMGGKGHADVKLSMCISGISISFA